MERTKKQETKTNQDIITGNQVHMFKTIQEKLTTQSFTESKKLLHN